MAWLCFCGRSKLRALARWMVGVPVELGEVVMGSEVQPPELSPVGNVRLCSQLGAEDQDGRTGVTGGYEGCCSSLPPL